MRRTPGATSSTSAGRKIENLVEGNVVGHGN
jgi:hypothetical protein